MVPAVLRENSGVLELVVGSGANLGDVVGGLADVFAKSSSFSSSSSSLKSNFVEGPFFASPLALLVVGELTGGVDAFGELSVGVSVLFPWL